MKTLTDMANLNPQTYRFETVSCYQCGSRSAKFFIDGEEDLTGKEGHFQFVRCNNCGLAYQNPRIVPEQIKDFYDSEYIAHRKKKDWGILTPLYERAMSKHDRDKEQIVRRYTSLNQSSRVLDVGCAVGSFLLHLKDLYGSEVYGVDFKDDLSFPRFSEIDFHCGYFYDQKDLPIQSFDLITMWHFLEHCYNPPRSLEKAKELLSPEGLLVIEVPRLDSKTFSWFQDKWPGLQAPQHTVLFDKESLISMVESKGFVVEDYLAYGAFPAYFYLFSGCYFKLIGKGLDLDKIVAPYFLGQLLTKPALLFEKKLNLAMQTVVCRVSRS